MLPVSRIEHTTTIFENQTPSQRKKANFGTLNSSVKGQRDSSENDSIKKKIIHVKKKKRTKPETIDQMEALQRSGKLP